MRHSGLKIVLSPSQNATAQEPVHHSFLPVAPLASPFITFPPLVLVSSTSHSTARHPCLHPPQSFPPHLMVALMPDLIGPTDTQIVNPDFEPDDDWKLNLRKEIEDGLQSLVDEAKRALDDRLSAEPVDEVTRQLLSKQHHETMTGIRELAKVQFMEGLNKERRLRRWSHGLATENDEFDDALVKEQQSILDNIKKEDGERARSKTHDQADEHVASANAGPGADRDMGYYVPISYRDSTPFSRGRRDSDNTSQHDGERTVGTPSSERPWTGQTLVEEPTELAQPGQRPIQRVPERSSYLPESANGRRYSASSPPKMMAIPEIWKPSISPEEDAIASNPYAAASRRGSATSTGSVGPSNYRSSVHTSQIPERASEVFDVVGNSERERAKLVEVDQEWAPLTKAREKEKQQSQSRSEIRQSTATELLNHRKEDHVPVLIPISPTRAVDSSSRGYQPSPSASRPLANKKSFYVDEHGRPDGQPQISQPPPSSFGNRPIVNKKSFSVDQPGRPDNQSRSSQPPTPIALVNKKAFSVDQPGRPDNQSRSSQPPPPPIALVNNKSFSFDEPGRPDSQSRSSQPPPSFPNRPLANKKSFSIDEPGRPDGQPRSYHHQPPAPSTNRPLVNKKSFSVDEPGRPDGGQSRNGALPLPSTGKSIVNKRSFTADEYGRYPPLPTTPKSGRWVPGSSRPPNDGRIEPPFPRLPQTPDENLPPPPRAWQPSVLRSPSVFGSKPDSAHDRPFDSAILQRDSVVDEESEEEEPDSSDDEEPGHDEGSDQWVLDWEIQSRRREDEARRKEEEARRKEEEAKRTEEEARVREEEARRKEEEARRKEEEAKRKEEGARRKEEAARKQVEEARRKEEEAKRKEEEAVRKEEEARRKEEAARLKEEETRRKEEQVRIREEDVKRREDELNRREAEAKRREEEKRLEEEEKRRNEEERQRAEERRQKEEQKQRLQEEENRKREEERRHQEEEKQRIQQEEFRKREEDIRRRAEERKRQDSLGSESNRAGSTYATTPAGPTWSVPNRTSTSPPTSPDRSSGSSNRSSASSNWSSSSGRPSSTTSSQASSTSRSSTTATSTGKPAASGPTRGADSSEAGTFPGTSYSSAERDWARRQAELAKEQQEKFRKEQERLERERQAKAAASGRIPTKEEVIHLFTAHERQWSMLPNLENLTWDSFPWPLLRRANNANDLTEGGIVAYVGSAHYPGDKSKLMKERIKDNIRRWHPDRFDTRLLTKVVDKDRAMVKEGADAVVRSLTNLLMSNSSVRDVFS